MKNSDDFDEYMDETNGFPDPDSEDVGIEDLEGKRLRTNILRELFSWVMVIAVAFVAAFIITHFIIIKSEVPSGSMQNTIQINDRLVGLRVAYLFSEPERGDIVIFKFPDNEEENYIKRVIGLPGETVEIIDGVVYIDGTALEEDYTKEGTVGNFGPYYVPENSYFMMGDNRQHSWDSRYWTNTFVTKDKILGKAWFRYAPSLHWY